MKTMLVQSESKSEDSQAAILINNEMKNGDCAKIIWYASFGKDLKDMKGKSGILASEVDRLTDRMVQCEKQIDPLTKEIQRLTEELLQLKKATKKSKEAELLDAVD